MRLFDRGSYKKGVLTLIVLGLLQFIVRMVS